MIDIISQKLSKILGKTIQASELSVRFTVSDKEWEETKLILEKAGFCIKIVESIPWAVQIIATYKDTNIRTQYD